MGVGGTPEGVISAAAIKCLGGAMQGRLWPRERRGAEALVDAGLDPGGCSTTDDLVGGEDVFVAATGVTRRAPAGVRYTADGAVTDSIVMRSRSGTVRRDRGQHRSRSSELIGRALPLSELTACPAGPSPAGPAWSTVTGGRSRRGRGRLRAPACLRAASASGLATSCTARRDMLAVSASGR